MHSTKEFLLVLNQKVTLLAILLGSAIFFGKGQNVDSSTTIFPDFVAGPQIDPGVVITRGGAFDS
jgi:hypothetical protein